MSTVTGTRVLRRLGATVAAAGVLGALIGYWLDRPGIAPGPARTGDARLIEDVEAGIDGDRGLGALSVARIAGGQAVFAGIGATGGSPPTPNTPYELGSIVKTWTGMLLADAADRGELALTDRLNRHLPELAGSAAGEVTLEELATHTSGLASLPSGVDPFADLFNNDPYGSWSTADVIAAAGQEELTGRGSHQYSNLGMSLVGHAVARAAGAPDWPTLLQQRLLQPLGMADTSIVTGNAEPAGAAAPHRANGWPAPWWTGEGFAPSGSSARTTAADLARYATAVLDGTAPGTSALQPRLPTGPDRRIGLAWLTESDPYGTSVWHNGGTAGTSTMLALDPAARTAVLVLNNSSRDVEAIAWHALFAGVPDAPTSRPELPVRGLIALAVGLALLATMLSRALRGTDRVGVLAGVADGAGGLVLALVHGPWEWLPGWLWGALAGMAVPVAVLAVRRAVTLPTWPARRRAAAITTAAVSGLLLVALLVTA